MTKKEENVLLLISFILNALSMNGHVYIFIEYFNKYRELSFFYIPFLIFSFMACIYSIVRGVYLNTKINDNR